MENQSLRMEVARLYRMEGEGRTKAFADIAIADAILIKGIRVVSGKKGLFVSMPREKAKDGTWYETIRPLTREVRDGLSRLVLEAYEQ